MKNGKTKLSRGAALLVIPALLFIFNCITASGAAAAQPVCGSVGKFNQKHRWQDLPGCTEGRDYSNPTSAAMLLSRAKGAFKDFFETWEKGDLDHVNSGSGGCLAFTYGAEDHWNSDPELVRAKPAYEEMKRKVEQYLKWLPLMGDLARRYIYAMTFLGGAKSGGLQSAGIAVSDAKKLQNAIAEAQRQNVPDDFLVPGSGNIPPATVGE